MLKKFLIWLYSPFKSDGGGDLKVVIFCVLAALIFWFFNAMNRDHAAVISYPIKFEYNDSSLIVVTPLPKKIAVQVQGYGWNLLRKTFWFNIDPINVLLTDPLNTKVITSKNLLPIVSEQLKGIKVNSLVKDTLWVNFERKVIKEQLVYVDSLKVSLANDLIITSRVLVEPSKVLVEGPESIVNALSDTLFLTIPKNNIDDAFDEDVKIFEVSNSVNYDKKKVRVTFEVAKAPEPPFVSLDSIFHNVDSSAIK